MRIKVALLMLALIPGTALADLSGKDLVQACKAYTDQDGTPDKYFLAVRCSDYVEGYLRGRGHNGPIKPVIETVSKQSPSGSAPQVISKTLD